MAIYKVTISEKDYDSSVYTTWVSATSKNQAIVLAAALVGGEKMRREHERMGRQPCTEDSVLLEPTVTLEPGTVDEYYANEHDVLVSTYETRRG